MASPERSSVSNEAVRSDINDRALRFHESFRPVESYKLWGRNTVLYVESTLSTRGEAGYPLGVAVRIRDIEGRPAGVGLGIFFTQRRGGGIENEQTGTINEHGEVGFRARELYFSLKVV